MSAERGGEASVLSAELDRNVRREHLHSGLGFGGGVRVRGMGQRNQFHQTSGYVRAFRQVLPVQAAQAGGASAARGA